MEPSQAPTKQCTMCGSDATRVCNICGCSAYCSRRCQKADRRIHRLLCDQLQNFQTPPKVSHRRGILFPQDSTSPRFVWVPTEMGLAPNAQAESYRLVMKHAYDGEAIPGRIRLTGHNTRSRVKDHEITILDNGNGTVDELGVLDTGNYTAGALKSNRCILAVAADRKVFDWQGPILAMKAAADTKLRTYADMDTVDFTDAVDLLCSSPTVSPAGAPSKKPILAATRAGMKISGSPRPLPTPNEGHILAVRINCPGIQKACGMEKFDVLSVPKDHPVCNAPISDISTLLGLPIRVIRCNTRETVQGASGLAPGVLSFNPTNKAATFLQLVADPNAPEPLGWGWAPEEWQSAAGSVLVVRKDHQPLHPQYLEALCHYCQYVLLPLFEDSTSGGLYPDLPIDKSVVLERMTPREFENFYIGYDDWKNDTDPSWDSKVPYLKLG